MNDIINKQIDILELAKSRIADDKNTFEYCGRKDTKGHFRSMMLIDEIIADLKVELK